MKTILLGGALAATLGLAACSDTVSTGAEGHENQGSIQPDWRVGEHTDEMTNRVTHFASIESTDKFESSTGLRKPSATELTVRQRGGRVEVMFENENLQILCGEYRRPLLVKFDDGKPQSYSCSETSTMDYGVGFIDNAPRFVANLRKAKRLVIQAEVFSRGAYTMHWDLPRPLPLDTSSPAGKKKSPPQARADE